MKRALVLAPEAVEEFGATLTFLAERSPRAATRLREQVEHTLEALAEGRFSGREVALGTGEVVRRWVVPPLVIYCEATQTELRIVRILHGARRPIER